LNSQLQRVAHGPKAAPVCHAVLLGKLSHQLRQALATIFQWMRLYDEAMIGRRALRETGKNQIQKTA